VTYCVRIIPFHPLELEFRGAQSKECQKRAWKASHKYNCSPNLPPAGEEDPLKPYNKIISAWQNEWKVTLDAFAVLALDLENNPGKNTTHWCVLCSVIVFLSDNPFAFSMFLEFKYTGGQANSRKFRVYWSYFCPALPSPLNTVQITCAALRTNEDVLAEAPHLHILRETPSLVGKQVRYAMVFYFEEEEGKPMQSFLRVRALLLDQSAMEVFKGGPAGWGNVSTTILQTFGSPGEPMMVYEVPVGQ